MESITGWFFGLGRLSLQAAVLVLLILSVQWIFRRQLSPQWRSALWLLLIVRLLLPVSFSSDVSVFNYVPEPATIIAAAPRLVAPAPVRHPAPGIPREELITSQEPALAGSPSPIIESAAIPQLEQASGVTASKPSVGTGKPFPWVMSLLVTWAAGMAGLLSWTVVASVRMARRFGQLSPIEDPDVRTLFDQCREQLGITRSIDLVESASVGSPALYGIFRPKLLLPAGFSKNFQSLELRFVFLHELAHVKRWDIPVNCLFTLLQAVHWFNPFVWIAFGRWRADRELACDSIALETIGGNQNIEYGRTILRLLDNVPTYASTPGLVGILENRKQLHQRILWIANFRPASRWTITSLILLLGLGAVCLTDAAARKEASDKRAATAVQPDRELRLGADPLPDDESKDAAGVVHRTMEITVTDPEGQPLANAEIHHGWEQPLPRRLTDKNGKFLLRFVQSSNDVRTTYWSISVQHPDYAGRSAAWNSPDGKVHAMLPKETTVQLERGVPVGGVVLDSEGKPISGVRVLLTGSDYRGFNIGSGENQARLSSVVSATKESPHAITDDKGRWLYRHFPADLKTVQIALIRPDDSTEKFSTKTENPFHNYSEVVMASLLDQSAVLTMRGGFKVRGIVVDESGNPIAGATVSEGHGAGNIQKGSQFVTDEKGRFECFNRAPREWFYTAVAEGYAHSSTIVKVQAETPEVKIVLPKARPLKVTFVDENEKPISGVKVGLNSYKNEGWALDWKAETKEDGTVIWTNAPLQELTFFSRATDRGRGFKAAGGMTKVVQMTAKAMEEISVQVKIKDGATGQPLTPWGVFLRVENHAKPVSVPLASELSLPVLKTDFRPGMAPTYQIEVEAEGYERFVSERMDFGDGSRDIEAALKAGQPLRATVLLPDGSPASEATLWMQKNNDYEHLFMNAPGRFYGDRMIQEDVKKDGTVTVPAITPPSPVGSEGISNPGIVFTHKKGILETTYENLKANPEVQLQPWGRVEGVVTVDGKPKPNLRLSLSSLNWGAASTPLNAILSATSDLSGAFVFTNVPPGEYKIHRQYRSRIGVAITESHVMPVSVAPGATAKIQYGGGGREVFGQLEANPPDAAVDWLNDDHVLVLKQKEIPSVNLEDFATFAGYQKARHEARNSPEHIRFQRERRSYVLNCERDGAFTIDDVPPGIYELQISVSKPKDRERMHSFNKEEIGSLKREVIVPEGREPFALGTLTVSLPGAAPAAQQPPLDMKARNLAGKEFSLQEYRGKVVLLGFWSSWSQRSTEQLELVQKLYQQLGKTPAFSIVTVSMDDELPQLKATVAERGYKWNQAYLDDAARADLTVRLNIEQLPAFLLLNKEGQIVNRDLDGDRLRVAVERALNKNK